MIIERDGKKYELTAHELWSAFDEARCGWLREQVEYVLIDIYGEDAFTEWAVKNPDEYEEMMNDAGDRAFEQEENNEAYYGTRSCNIHDIAEDAAADYDLDQKIRKRED